MAAIVSVISAISGICSVIKFGQYEFAQAQASDSSLKIEVGLDYAGGLQGAGGDLPDVRLWNEAGVFIGIAADPGYVNDGTQGQVSVGSQGQESTYVLFSANNDAICVAYVSLTWPNNNHYGWDGSWGKQCGGTWYWSNVYINNQNYKPPCLWIDANGDQPQTGFSLHFPEFVSPTGKVPAGKDTSYFCDNTPVFQLHYEQDPSSINFWVLGNNSKLMSRSEKAPALPKGKARFNRHPAKTIDRTDSKASKASKKASKKAPKKSKKISPHLNKLVISDDAVNHPTAVLCESKTSVGPDFVNTAEGQYCHMADHTLYPVCDKKTTDNCFNMDTQSLVVGGKAARNTPYEWVQDWRSTSN